jgi:MtN3 and saliva related transmembrane protein
VAFWLLFGFLIDNWPIMISNAVTLVLTLAIVAMKLRYG